MTTETRWKKQGQSQALAQIADWIAQERDKVKTALDEAAATLTSAGLKVEIVMKDQEPKRARRG